MTPCLQHLPNSGWSELVTLPNKSDYLNLVCLEHKYAHAMTRYQCNPQRQTATYQHRCKSLLLPVPVVVTTHIRRENAVLPLQGVCTYRTQRKRCCTPQAGNQSTLGKHIGVVVVELNETFAICSLPCRQTHSVSMRPSVFSLAQGTRAKASAL